jgi:hypothetical protein
MPFSVAFFSATIDGRNLIFGHKIHSLKLTLLKPGVNSGVRISSSCSTSGASHVTLATNPVINHELGKERAVLTTNGTYTWVFVTQILRNG